MSRHEDTPELKLERFRPYLVLLAQTNLGRGLHTKLDASDIVQQTLLEAHRKREQFRGHDEAELAAWLRQMLAFAIADAHRTFHRPNAICLVIGIEKGNTVAQPLRKNG